MFRTVRAAGLAVAACLLSAGVAWSDPSQAGQNHAAPVASHWLDHVGAGPAVSDLGLNEVEATAAAAPAATQVAAHVGAMAEQLIALADATIPRPRALPELIPAYADAFTIDREEDCLANAVYFEARGEPIEGQLAVAEVVLNRTQSSRYGGSICEVVTAPWQFSFVRNGIIPAANRSSHSWRQAVAIAKIARAGASRLLPQNVLWYHADYVSPSWGRQLDRTTKIGLHIFYN